MIKKLYYSGPSKTLGQNPPLVLYGHVQNIYNVKLMLKFLNRNTCRNKKMYITLE